MSEHLDWANSPLWSMATRPLFQADASGVTILSIAGSLAVLLLGVLLDRQLCALLRRLGSQRSEFTPERQKLVEQITHAAVGIGTVLTALRTVGLSLETLRFVWGLFNHPLLVLAGTQLSVVTILTVVLVVVAGFRLSELVQMGVSRWSKTRDGIDPGSVGTAQRLLHYTVVGLSLVIAMQTIGINLDAVLAAGAVFAVGFGLAMQGIAQNFVSGIILLLERSIRPGDVVEVSGKLVRVEAMAVRSTVVVGLDGDRHIVPNSALVQSAVRNLTMQERPVRVHSRVGVAYHLDPEAVTEVLMGAATELSGRLPDRPPVVNFDSFGDSALEFDVFVWIEEPWTLPVARAELNRRIWKALRDHAMPIPFPQRDLHIVSSPSGPLPPLRATSAND